MPDQNRTLRMSDQNRTLRMSDQNRTLGMSDQNRTLGMSDQNRTFGMLDQNRTFGMPDQNRTFGMPDQNRTLGIPDQNRTLGMPDQNRTLGMPDQNRTFGMPDQNRTLGMPDQNRTLGMPDQNRTQNNDFDNSMSPSPLVKNTPSPSPKAIDKLPSTEKILPSPFVYVHNATNESTINMTFVPGNRSCIDCFDYAHFGWLVPLCLLFLVVVFKCCSKRRRVQNMWLPTLNIIQRSMSWPGNSPESAYVEPPTVRRIQSEPTIDIIL